MFSCFSANSNLNLSFNLDKPQKRRSTDLFCIFIFLLFLSFFISYSTFALIYGNPLRLINGVDSFGNICGIRNSIIEESPNSGLDLSDRAYLFYANANNLSSSLQICVKKCPDVYIQNPQDLITFYRNTNISLCRYDTKFEDYVNAAPSDPIRRESDKGFGPCPSFPVYKSVSMMNRCIPKDTFTKGKSILFKLNNFLNTFDFLGELLKDFISFTKELNYVLILALVLSFLVIHLFSLLSAFFIFLLLVVFPILCISIVGYMWFVYYDISTKNKNNTTYFISDRLSNEKNVLILAILTTIIASILLLVVFLIRNSLRSLVRLFKLGSKVFKSYLIILQPFLTLALIFLVSIIFILTLMAIFTAREQHKNTVNSNSDSHFLNKNINRSYYIRIFYSKPYWIYYLYWFHLFLYIWIIEFIIGCGQMTVASCAARWYFTKDYKNKSSLSLFVYGFKITLKHLGSILFGSFMIVLLIIPRIILAFIEKILESKSKYKFINSIIEKINAVLECLAKFVKFYNRNVYIVIAIEGCNYCQGVKKVSHIFLENVMQLFIINTIGDTVLFIGKCSVAIICSLFGLYRLHNDENVNNYTGPFILFALFAYLLADSIISVYEMYIDSLFICLVYKAANSKDGEQILPESLLYSKSGDKPKAVEMKNMKNEDQYDDEDEEIRSINENDNR